MSSIDERVVEMKFKDSSFQEGVSRTLDNLKKLKDNLKLEGAAEGLTKVGEAADKLDLNGVKESAAGISPLFAGLATIGITALSRLTNAALDFGKGLVDNVMEPLFGGGERRALNLESARYSFRMLGIDAVKAMEDANYAVEGTAYGLDVAAKAASQLSASQVALGTDMKAALRGISGVAALTNSSYEDISNVFTKVAGQGRLMGDDLNRLGSRGMNAAAVLGKAFGKTEEEIRKMVSKGQISFAEFAKAMDDAYGEKAVSAAETYSGALGQMNTALARIGADIAAPKLEALRRIYNALAPAINGVKFALQPILDMFGEMQVMKADGIVAMLEDIVNVGFGDKADAASPLVALQEGFKNVADSIMNVVRPIREAWNQVFPPSLGGMISKFAFWFRDFTGSIKITGEAAAVIKTIFVALFSTLKIGFSIISGVLGVVFNGLSLFFQLIRSVLGIFTPFIGYIYNLITGLTIFDGATKNSTGAVETFFNALKWAQNAILKPIIALFTGLGKAIDDFLNNGLSAKEVLSNLFSPLLEQLKKVGAAFGVAGGVVEERFGAAGTRIKAVWDGILSVIKTVGAFFAPIASAMGGFFSKVRDGFIRIFEGADLNTLLAGINTGVLLVLFNSIRKAITGLGGAFTAVGNIKTSFLGAIDGITGTLDGMQKKLRADAILKIAIAIGVLALSLGILATIEPERLISSATGLGVAVGALLTAMKVMSGILETKGLIKMPLIAYSLILLGTALTILSLAVRSMGSLSWEELLKGLTGLAVALGALMGAMTIMNKMKGGLVKTAAALLVLSVALYALVGVIAILGNLKMEVLVQGFISLIAALGLLVGAAMLLSKNAGGMTKAAGGILAMATALGMLVGVILIFGLVPWPIIVQGMISLGVLMAGLIVAANLLSKNAGGMTKAAGGLLAMALAIGMLVTAIVILGSIDLPTLIQGLVGIAAAIVILVVAAKSMTGIEKGVAGMIALSFALLILSVSLKLLSTIPLEALLASLIAIGALLIMLGFAGTVLGPVAPGMMAVAGAAALLGLAFLLISASIFVFALAITALGPALISLTGGLIVFAEASDKIVQSVPAMLAIGLGLIVFGLGAAVAAIGVGLLGVALILMGVGLALIGAVGLIGAVALTAVALAIVDLIQYAGQLTVMGGVLAVLGTGMILVGIGGILAAVALLAIAAGMAAIAGALFLLGPAMMAASMGMAIFLPQVSKFVETVPELIALGVGIAAFGAGAGVAALGILLLGVALIALGAGLMLVKAAGTGSAKSLAKITETIAGLWGHALNIGIIATAFGVLGASLLVLGAGLLVTGAGAMLVVVALFAFVGVAALFGAAAKLVVSAIEQLATVTGSVSKSAGALDKLGGAISKFGANSMMAAAGVTAITIGFFALMNACASLNTAIQGTTKIVSTSMKTIITSVNQIPPAFTKMVTSALSAFNKLPTGITLATLQVSIAAIRLGAVIKTNVSNAVNGAKTVASSGGSSIGKAIVDGMTRGLNNNGYLVRSAARRVAQDALNAAKAALDSNSPSKKFIKLGEDSDEGFALGFEGNAARVARAAADVGEGAMGALKKSISDISNAVAIDPSMRPTITPVLDLSLIRKDAPLLSGILKNPNLNLASAYNSARGIDVGTVNTDTEQVAVASRSVIFNQTNNSPKALSVSEVYRQTNNQISRLEKGVGASDVD